MTAPLVLSRVLNATPGTGGATLRWLIVVFAVFGWLLVVPAAELVRARVRRRR